MCVEFVKSYKVKPVTQRCYECGSRSTTVTISSPIETRDKPQALEMAPPGPLRCSRCGGWQLEDRIKQLERQLQGGRP